MKRLNTKLNYIKLKFYSIQKVLNKSIYRLKLLNIIRIHFIFNISLLKSILNNVKQTLIYLNNQNQKYKMKKVLNNSEIKDKIYYYYSVLYLSSSISNS